MAEAARPCGRLFRPPANPAIAAGSAAEDVEERDVRKSRKSGFRGLPLLFSEELSLLSVMTTIGSAAQRGRPFASDHRNIPKDWHGNFHDASSKFSSTKHPVYESVVLRCQTNFLQFPLRFWYQVKIKLKH